MPTKMPTPIVVDVPQRAALDGSGDETAGDHHADGGTSGPAWDFRSDSGRDQGLLPGDANGRVDVRAAGRQRRQAGIAVARWGQDHDRHPRQGACLSVRASRRCIAGTGQATRPAEARQRLLCRHEYSACRIQVLRQPAEVPPVRVHVQREDRRRQPDFARTRQFTTGATGAESSMPVLAMAPCCHA